MRIISHLAILSVMMVVFSCSNNNKTTKNPQQTTVNNDLEAGKITLGATEESIELARKLASAYVAENTNIIVDVQEVVSQDADSLIAEGSIQALISATPVSDKDFLEKSIIAHDVLVLAVSFNNTALQYLVMRGLDLKELNAIFASAGINNWQQVDKKSESVPVKPLAGPASESQYNMLISLLGITKTSGSVTMLMSERELYDAVASNPGAIALMSHRMCYGPSGMRADGLYIIPIDFNGNNVADDEELVYDDLNMLKKANSKKKIPASLIRNHILVRNMKAERKDILEHFAKWISEKGASIASSAGYFEPNKP